jgi:Tfp pilus assembly protein FimT
MKKRKKDQSGFAHLEKLLLLVIVAIIAFVGWYVFHSVSQADKNLNSANGGINATASKKNSTKQSGSSSVNGTAKTTSPTAASPVPATVVSEAPKYETTTPTVVNNYVTINEWNVKFKQNGTVTIMYAHDSNDKNHRSAFFSSSQLASKNNACKAVFYPAGYIVRFKANDHYLDSKGSDTGKTASEHAAMKSEDFKQVGDYYYFYRGPVAKCAELKEVQDLQDQTAEAVKAFLASLEAAS